MPFQNNESKQEEVLSASSNSITEIVETLETLEMTPLPSCPVENDGSETVSEKAAKYARIKRQVQFLTMCLCFVQEGWHDGSTGPLLPRIQSYYRVNFAIVSLIFLSMAAGCLIGAVLNVHLTERYGFGKVVVFGTLTQLFAFVMESTAPPFPVWVLAFGIYGFGTSLQNSQVNAFVAGLKDPQKMSILHAAYGLGALASPFVATQFAQAKHWSFHYLTVLGIGLCNITALIYVFRFRTQDEILVEAGLSPAPASTSTQNSYRQILGLSVVHLLALFIFAYCGLEVTIGGWAVTYLINLRGGGPSTGYVSSGFFGGLAGGRIALIQVTKMIGAQRAIFAYAVLAIVLEIIIWFVPSLIGDAVAIALVGLLLGPMFPIIMSQCGSIIPRWLLPGSIGWISCFGIMGTAVFPFITGVLANKYGVISLQPMLLGLLALLIIMWTLVNIKTHRID